MPPLLLLTPAHRVVEDTSRMTLSMPAAENERGDTAEVGTLHGETGDLGPLNLGTPVFVRAKDDAPAAPLNGEDEAAEDMSNLHLKHPLDIPTLAVYASTPKRVSDIV